MNVRNLLLGHCDLTYLQTWAEELGVGTLWMA